MLDHVSIGVADGAAARRRGAVWALVVPAHLWSVPELYVTRVTYAMKNLISAIFSSGMGKSLNSRRDFGRSNLRDGTGKPRKGRKSTLQAPNLSENP
jgi:hypothetical protein